MIEEMDLEGQINLHQQKSKHTYGKIEGCINRIIQLYEAAQKSLDQGKDPTAVIQELNLSLLNIKPIKTIRDSQMHYYKKLSNLLKKMQSSGNKNLFSQSRFSRKIKSQIMSQQNDQNKLQKKIQQFLNQFINKLEQVEALDQIIVEHYLRNGRWDCADVWPDIRKKIDPCNLFQECIRLKELIEKGQFQQTIRWCQNERLYQTHENLLQYELHKLNVAKIISEKTVEQALNYFSSNFGKFHSQFQEVQLIIGFLLYKGKWGTCFLEPSQAKSFIEQRFSRLEYSSKRCLSLANAFQEEYFKHNSINRFNILKILYNCSHKISEDYNKLMRLMWEGQHKNSDKKQISNTLPFSVKLDKEYQYHSLFLCPVTKEVQSGNEKSILLSCGHLISSAAHSRILQQNRSRRKVKCPICQKEINHEQSMNIQF